MHTYTWGAQDTLWGVCARFLAESGWPDVASFREAVVAANPTYTRVTTARSGTATVVLDSRPEPLYDWMALPEGARIALPFTA